MTYRGALNVSSCQETAIAPRSHARASRRARSTSASYLADRIRTMLPAASKSSKVSMTDARNALCFFADSVDRCAFSSTEINVNSTDGGGISEVRDGVRLVRSGNTHTPSAPTRKDFISTGNSSQRKLQVIHEHDSLDTVVNAALQAEKAGLNPDPSLCCLTVSGRASLQGAGNLWRLPEGFGAATPSRLRKPVGSPVNHLTRRKVHGDDLAHLLSSKCAPRLEASQ